MAALGLGSCRLALAMHAVREAQRGWGRNAWRCTALWKERVCGAYGVGGSRSVCGTAKRGLHGAWQCMRRAIFAAAEWLKPRTARRPAPLPSSCSIPTFGTCLNNPASASATAFGCSCLGLAHMCPARMHHTYMCVRARLAGCIQHAGMSSWVAAPCIV